jgi:hypothetical protein
MDGKTEQSVCTAFCTVFHKSATKTLEMLCEARQWFLDGIHVLRQAKYRLKMMNIQGYQVPAKQQKILKKI